MHKSSLLIFLVLLVFLVGGTVLGGVFREDERKALLAIKDTIPESPYVEHILPTWVNDGGGSDYCEWERIKCDTTSHYVTHLSFNNIFSLVDHDENYADRYYEYYKVSLMKIWPLNFSMFLDFKELISLDLSGSYIGNIGLEGLSGLKKLEMLNLSANFIETNIFPSLSHLTSLKILDLGYMNLTRPYPPPLHDISEIPSLENLEVLDLSACGFYGTLEMQGSHGISMLSKLKVQNLRGNHFNESFVASLGLLPSLTTLDLSFNGLSGSFPIHDLSRCINLEKLDLSSNYLSMTPNISGSYEISILSKLEVLNLANNNFNESFVASLGVLPSLKVLDLSYNDLYGSFPIQELNGWTNLEELDLSDNHLNMTPSISDCKSLMRLERLKSISLRSNYFNKSIISCLSFLPSLNILDLSGSKDLGSSFPIQELCSIRHLKTLEMSGCGFEDSLNLTTFYHLKVLDLSYNNLFGSIPSFIKSLSSLEIVSFAYNNLNGSLASSGLCELKSLYELDLSNNMLDGTIPECFNTLSSLKIFDISRNRFTGLLPPSLFVNLTSLEHVDISHNKFEGSFPFSSFSNLYKLEVVVFKSDTDKFEVETEEPKGWVPRFQLKVLVLSYSNLNKHNKAVFPSFLLHQHKLQILDLSGNSLEEQFPNWMLKNNTKLESLILRNNSFPGMTLYTNANVRLFDMSENHMTDIILEDIPKYFPRIEYLNLSSNAINGHIPSSISDCGLLRVLDLSNNELSGEVPHGLFTNYSVLSFVKLSNNRLYGNVLSGNLSLGDNIEYLYLDNNLFTGDIGNNTKGRPIQSLDIGDNNFRGKILDWITNMVSEELVMRNNNFIGQFPCGEASFSFLDISQNSFSGVIPSCNFQSMKHLHLGSNKFIGSIPNSFRILTEVLTLDVGNNYLSGTVPKFLGELSKLRILILGKNNFVSSIPNELCHLKNLSLIDLSSNSLTGLIPRCLQNITGPQINVFVQGFQSSYSEPYFHYKRFIRVEYIELLQLETRDEAHFTTKGNSLEYKGYILNYMSGLDLSCNKLEGEIPSELGMLTHILALNLSHNQLTGTIPVSFSNLTKIESLDLSSNVLTGKVPPELTKLNFMAVFNVSHNNLSGKLPEKGQFATFSIESYEGNPFLCGKPLENKCTSGKNVSDSSNDEKWYGIDKATFYGSFGSMWFMFMLGCAAALYINPYWRKRWMDFVEESVYTCYYFLYDLVKRPSVLFHN